MSDFRRVRVKERFNEYGYGPYDYLFGKFPKEAVSIDGEQYSIDETLLEEGDYVAFRTSMFSGGMLDGDSKPQILAHRLPIGEVPENWEPVGGETGLRQPGRSEKRRLEIIKVSDGSRTSFEQAVEELNLKTMPHPYGQIWMEEDGRPVAVNAPPKFSVTKNDVTDIKEIRGDRAYFHRKGLAIIQTTARDAYYNSGTFYGCSRNVKIRGFSLDNLREGGWYPVQVNEHFVLWGTGLYLYPKHLEWHVGTEGPREDGLGTLLFDSNRGRLKRVREFFREAVGVRVNQPQQEYIRWANDEDPRCGEWRTSHDYPDIWVPHFSGWELERFPEVECRWQQPLFGPPHFYAVVR